MVAWRCTACGNDRKGVFTRGQESSVKAFFYLSRRCVGLRAVTHAVPSIGEPVEWLALRKFLNGFWKGRLDTMLSGLVRSIRDTI